jgi:hypothetical protein
MQEWDLSSNNRVIFRKAAAGGDHGGLDVALLTYEFVTL